MSDRAVGAGYDAFISYSQAVDGALAPALRRALLRIGVPWYRRSSRSIFLDNSSLAADASLAGALSDALERSRFLVVLLSPEAARSRWVDQEIERWLRSRPIETVVPVVTCWRPDQPGANLAAFDWRGGDVPPALRGRFADEPRPVDLRWVRGSPRDAVLGDERFRNGVAEIAARLLHRSKEALVDEDRRRRRQARGLLVVGLTVLVALAAVAAEQAKKAARHAAEVVREERLGFSRRVAELSRANLPTRHALAALLAVQAFQIADTPQARGAMLWSLTHQPDVRRNFWSDGSELTAAAVSPDGGMVAAGARAGRVFVWDASTGGRRSLQVADSLISALAFMKDRLVIATAGRLLSVDLARLDGPVAAWSRPSAGAISKLVVSPAGDRLAVIAGRAPIDLYDPGGRAVELPIPPMATRDPFVSAAAFSPNGRFLGAGFGNGAVCRWSVTAADLLHPRCAATAASAPGDDQADRNPFAAGRRLVHALLVLDDGRIEAMINKGKTRAGVVVDVDRARIVHEVTFGDDRDAVLDLAPDGSTVALESVSRGRVIVLDLTARQPSREFVVHDSFAIGGVFALRSSNLITFDERRVVLIDLVEPRAFVLGAFALPNAREQVFRFSGDGRMLAYTQGDQVDVLVVRADNGQRVAGPLHTPGDGVADIQFAPSGRLVAAATDGGSVLVWSLPDGHELARRTTHAGGAAAVAFSPDESCLAVAGEIPDADARLPPGPTGPSVDAAPSMTFAPPNRGMVAFLGAPSWSRQPQQIDVATESPLWDVAFIGAGQTLAVAAGDGVRFWNAATKRPVFEQLLISSGLSASLAVSADGGRFVAAASGTVVFADGRSGRALSHLIGHATAIVSSVAMTADGRTAASAADGQARLWDVESGVEIGPFLQLFKDGTHTVVGFGDGGRVLLAASRDGVARIGADVQQWRAQLCALVNRTFTLDEWSQLVGAPAAHLHPPTACAPSR